MSNSLISVTEIARQTMLRLNENLVFPNLIHRDYSSEFVAEKGNKIQVKKPVRLTASEFNATDGVSAQTVTDESVEVTLDKIADVSVEFSAIEKAFQAGDAALNRLFIEPAAIAIAEKANSDGLLIYRDIPYVGGTAGTTPDGTDDFAAARKMLNDQKVPVSPRNAVWDTTADSKFVVLDAFLEADKAGTTEALRNGNIGRIMGIDNYTAQSVKTHTKGTLAAGGTTPKITVKTAVTTAASQVVLDVTASANGTLTGTLVVGDILTIDGKTYVVTEAAEAADNEITVKVYPAIKVAADKEVTVTANHTANLVFHPSAFAFVNRPLAKPAGVESYVVNQFELSLRVVRGYDMKYKKEMLSMDILYTYKTMYPELAVRYLG